MVLEFLVIRNRDDPVIMKLMKLYGWFYFLLVNSVKVLQVVGDHIAILSIWILYQKIQI